MGEQWVGADPSCTPTSLVRWKEQVDQWNPDMVILFGAQQGYDRRIDGVEILYDTPEGEQRSFNDLKAATDPTQVHVVDINSFLNPNGTYADTINGVASRTDGIHLTDQVAKIAAEWLVPQLIAVPRRTTTR